MKYILLACSALTLLLTSYNTAKVRQLDYLRENLQMCEWDMGNYTLSVIRGSKAAHKAKIQVGRPSDKGGC